MVEQDRDEHPAQDDARWDRFVRWAKKISEHDSFRPRERDYKLEYA